MPAIVLIEDSLPLQKNIELLLSANGYDVDSFTSGEPALEKIATSPPDLILCDIVLPGMDGYQVLHRVREMVTGLEIPFVFLSALAEKDHVRRGMDLGADDYITKPFTTAGLLAAVQARLERSTDLRGVVEHEFRQYQKQKLLSLPHELRTPLNGIAGGISLLREETEKHDHKIHDLFAIVESSAERLEKTLLKYLLFLELKCGQISLCDRRKDVDAGLVVASVATRQAREAGRENDLRLHTQEVLVPCADCLDNVVAEVVSNAFKFSEAGSRVEVRMTTDDGRVCVTCRDHGYGMTAEEIAAIAPFVQFHRKEREQQGLGLGLAICMELIKCEGCELKLRPADGAGLVAELFLPMQPATR
ncbi:MAG: hybrid sensor histidine kinase/response regulator [Verrucomicrobiaceae bacterium]|nr:MAG: hybrid sensor histidine kinase/response regulator [Verrucomicrobiaceae bacterium]